MSEVSHTGNVSVPQCKKCHYGEQHPWHDNGTANWIDMWMWEVKNDSDKTGR